MREKFLTVFMDPDEKRLVSVFVPPRGGNVDVVDVWRRHLHFTGNTQTLDGQYEQPMLNPDQFKPVHLEDQTSLHLLPFIRSFSFFFYRWSIRGQY